MSQRFKQLIETIHQQLAQLDGELPVLVQVEQKPGTQEPAEEGQRTERVEQQWRAAIALLVTIPGTGLLTACWQEGKMKVFLLKSESERITVEGDAYP